MAMLEKHMGYIYEYEASSKVSPRMASEGPPLQKSTLGFGGRLFKEYEVMRGSGGGPPTGVRGLAPEAGARGRSASKGMWEGGARGGGREAPPRKRPARAENMSRSAGKLNQRVVFTIRIIVF